MIDKVQKIISPVYLVGGAVRDSLLGNKPYLTGKRFGTLMMKVGAELVEQLARYFRWSNDRRETVINLVLNHLKDDSPLREYDIKGK